MSSLREELRLVINGDSSGGVRALRDYIEETRRGTTITGGWSKGLERGSAHSLTFSRRVQLMRIGVGKLAKGELPKASEALGMAASGLGKFVAIAGASIGVVAGAAAIVRELMGEYIELGKKVGMVNRIAGTEGAEGNALRVQFQMLGLDIEASASSLGMFSKKLGEAQRTGQGPAADAFTRLGIDLRDQNGELRDNADVLAESREKLSELRKENLNAARETASDIFGKGYMSLDKWLGASIAKIEEFNKIAAESGVDWDDKKLAKYLEDTRHVSVTWGDLQAMLGQDLMPLLSDELIPALKEITTELHNIPHLGEGIGKGLKIGFAPLKEAGIIVANLFGVLGGIANMDFRGAFDSLKKAFESYLDFMLASIGGLPGWVVYLLKMRDEDKHAETAAGLTTVDASTPAKAQASAQDVKNILSGFFPGLANEGLVKARLGGTIVRLAEAGEDEVVLKASRFRSGPEGRSAPLVDLTVHMHADFLATPTVQQVERVTEMVSNRISEKLHLALAGVNVG